MKKMNPLIMSGILLIASQSNADLQITGNGRSSNSKMLKIKRGIPSYTFNKKVSEIPLLDIGQEPTLSDVVNTSIPSIQPIIVNKLQPVTEFKLPKTVDTAKYLRTSFSTFTKAQEIIKINPQFKAPEITPLPKEEPLKITSSEVVEKDILNFSVNDIKRLQAQIFLEIHKKYYLALGLIAEIVESTKEIKGETSYLLGLSAEGNGLHSEATHHLRQSLKDKNDTWQKASALKLAELARSEDYYFVDEIDEKIDAHNISFENYDQYQMNRARFYLEKGDLGRAEFALSEIKEKSDLHADAQFLRSILAYRAGRVSDALAFADNALNLLDKNKNKSEIKSIAALTLGRLLFQQGKYKEAFDAFLKVEKSNPLFTQAMTEQAWAQIRSDDYEGAAGNMYSLHTDFFKHTFAPESYVVRTVGYVNLCQYGDALKALYSLNKRYQPMKEQMSKYLEKNKKRELAAYDTVRQYFKNQEAKEIDGLHRNFIYEWARHPGFMNPQRLINLNSEQESRWNQFSLDVVSHERDLLKKIQEQEKLLSEKKSNSLDIAALKEQLHSNQLQYEILKRARSSIKPIRENSLNRMKKENEKFKKQADVALKERFLDMHKTLIEVLDQSEVLGYEVYSGAGEHIRYQSAGGEINDKERVELTVKNGKAVKWEFKGEIWEDELGHFRSSLKNVCPN